MQSLCSRDKFSIQQADEVLRMFVAIPLQQGQVFNQNPESAAQRRHVAIPLRQGQVFNSAPPAPVARLRRNPFEAGTSFQLYRTYFGEFFTGSQSL